MPGYADDAVSKLGNEVAMQGDLKKIQNALDNAWSASHYDHYHTEVYYTTSCTSNGNGGQSCHQEMHTRQVYDYTTHSYRYDTTQGQLAATLLSGFTGKYPDVKVDEKLKISNDVSDYNKSVIDASRGDSAEPLTDEEYASKANTWALGSNFNASQPKVEEGHQSLKNTNSAWAQAVQTAHSDSYITYSHYDSGPHEYQIANDGVSTASHLNGQVDNIVQGIRHSSKAVPELNDKVEEYIDVVLNGKKGDAGQLRKEIMDIAKDIYDKNDGNGFDVHTMKWLNIFLFALAGLVAGAGAGKGIDALLNTRAAAMLRKDKEQEQRDEAEEEREEEEERLKREAEERARREEEAEKDGENDGEDEKDPEKELEEARGYVDTYADRRKEDDLAAAFEKAAEEPARQPEAANDDAPAAAEEDALEKEDMASRNARLRKRWARISKLGE